MNASKQPHAASPAPSAVRSPLAQVQQRFGDKAGLVAAVQSLATPELWLDRTSEAKGLARVSNEKLLRLHAALSRVKSDFGSRAALIDAVLGLQKRVKDDGLKSRLSAFPLPRLLDEHDVLARRVKRAASQPAKVAGTKRVVRTKKARAKAAAH